MTTRRRAGAGRDRTSQLMVEIRGAARQVDAATRSGLTQSKVSRGEQGTFTLSPEDADVYARAMGATTAQRRELVDLCRAAQANAVPRTALRLVRSRTEIQRRIGKLEQQSTLIRSWQPDVVPGLLQTRAYTAALLGEVDDSWWAARQARQAGVGKGSTLHVLVSEAVLRWVVGSRDVMRDQLAHLADVSRHDSVRFGVVPFGQTKVPPPEGAFHLYGDRVVAVATMLGTTFDDQGLDMFADLFDSLDGVAAHGDEARKLIERADR